MFHPDLIKMLEWVLEWAPGKEPIHPQTLVGILTSVVAGEYALLDECCRHKGVLHTPER